MRKAIVVLSLVGVTLVASAGDANAQFRVYGGWWGIRPVYSVGWVNSGYFPAYGYYSSYYRPYSLGYGYSYTPYYYSTVPTYAVNLQPATTLQPTPAEPERASQFVTMTVVVPTADAQVWFENTPTAQQGTERVFHSPALELGKTFIYTIKARWMENGQPVERERQVKVQAGQKITVNFRHGPGDLVPAPEAAARK
jgi:uncharacterized protein (TIGR03000 family)